MMPYLRVGPSAQLRASKISWRILSRTDDLWRIPSIPAFIGGYQDAEHSDTTYFCPKSRFLSFSWFVIYNITYVIGVRYVFYVVHTVGKNYKMYDMREMFYLLFKFENYIISILIQGYSLY